MTTVPAADSSVVTEVACNVRPLDAGLDNEPRWQTAGPALRARVESGRRESPRWSRSFLTQPIH
ncbi:hypothetical protein IA539_13810 [Gordonia sp. zg691]|uniref:Uncharacterized protein n=1 Tax=Gordonia jinghuaiqii TaxID=2758710 RepID=A0A7D7QJ59_9ACTN|nr:hypothetical protein [Gordonia jinghuaiqii]MBD0862283.1 hypothetical protein [Gordonia jinghuaiqii]MCR5978493.1 hypothetical protein [Gordonia jinghuaiqii]QMT02824.1 hypothetical protein H1R19_06760 [Gordonia jinghuaiqii]